MDRQTIADIDIIKEQLQELLSRTWLIMEKIRPDIIKELVEQDEKNKNEKTIQ